MVVRRQCFRLRTKSLVDFSGPFIDASPILSTTFSSLMWYQDLNNLAALTFNPKPAEEIYRILASALDPQVSLYQKRMTERHSRWKGASFFLLLLLILLILLLLLLQPLTPTYDIPSTSQPTTTGQHLANFAQSRGAGRPPSEIWRGAVRGKEEKRKRESERVRFIERSAEREG